MADKDVVVLRYGHRAYRDQRVTTHCCLVSRALGAQRVIIEGDEDPELLKTVAAVNKAWGQGIEVEFCAHWKPPLKALKEKGYIIVHLTMYGQELMEEIPKIRRGKKVCVVIGSQKVEREVYKLADYNLSVGSTPHSEIAALALFLHELFQGKELGRRFEGARLAIHPSKTGKDVRRIG